MTDLQKDLEKIIEINTDSVKGYETAAENIKRGDLQTLFLRLSQQRKGFIEEIKNEGLRLGMELNTSGSVQGFFHRTWLATKATFSPETNQKVIDESMFGEKNAIDVYANVINDTEVPEFLRETLTQQQKLIKVAIQQLSGLKTEVG